MFPFRFQQPKASSIQTVNRDSKKDFMKLAATVVLASYNSVIELCGLSFNPTADDNFPLT